VRAHRTIRVLPITTAGIRAGGGNSNDRDRDFPDHWKTRLVIGALGYSAVGGILRLWAHCEARRDDTFEMTPEVLKAVTQIDAKPAEIERALIDARFIERRRKAVYVRGWREKTPASSRTSQMAAGEGAHRKPTAANSIRRQTQRKPIGFANGYPSKPSHIQGEESRGE
jgi:hypothetical protein